MRVTDTMQMENWLRSLQRTSQRMEQAQTTLASGKALQKPSDDPTGMSRAIVLREQISREQQYIYGIDDGTGWLKTVEVVLGSVSDSLTEANEIGLLGANAAVSPEQRQDLANRVGQMIEHMEGLANAQYAGSYIFSGEKISVKPFQLNETKTSVNDYAGGTGSISRQIQGANTISVNYSGKEIFVDTKVFDSLFQLKQSLEGDDYEGIQQALKDVNQAFNQVVSIRAVVGSKINRMGEMKELHELQKSHFESLLSDVEEGDLAEVITELKREQMAYEAALAVGARISSLSLLDYLR